MLERLDDSCKRLLVDAQGHATRFNHPVVGEVHFLLAVVADPAIAGPLIQHGVDDRVLESWLRSKSGAEEAMYDGTVHFSTSFQRVLHAAAGATRSSRRERRAVHPHQLVAGIVDTSDDVARLLAANGIDTEALRRALRNDV
jgi:ATP-dependent Clp protease ATP-binding subunit ClpA